MNGGLTVPYSDLPSSPNVPTMSLQSYNNLNNHHKQLQEEQFLVLVLHHYFN